MMRDSHTTIDLLRHGKPEGGEIFRGKTDVPLSSEGFVQMRASIERLPAASDVDVIVSSPMQRCMAYAEEIAALLDRPLDVVDGFKEISFGDWDGMTFSQVNKQYGDLYKRFWKNPILNTPPNAEAMQDFVRRVEQAYLSLLNKYKEKHILLVVHGGTIRAILSEILSCDSISLMRFEVPYACISRVKIYHENDQHWPQLVFHNI